METFWAVVLIVLGLLAWVGQGLARFSPSTAEKLSFVEKEETVEPVYWADIRGEALWDFFTLWTVPTDPFSRGSGGVLRRLRVSNGFGRNAGDGRSMGPGRALHMEAPICRTGLSRSCDR
jgi:hypothetical protein